MLPGNETVRAIWEHVNPIAVWLNWTAEIQNGHFREAPGLPETQPIGADMYFAPGAFGKDGKRTNENLRSFNILWADLDDKFDHEQIRNPFPTFMWETSPGMYQAVWLLKDSFKNYNEWSLANKALTYRVGADKGGWAGSKLLRIPETYNYKRYDGVTLPKGGPVKYNPTELWTADFSTFIPGTTVYKGESAYEIPPNDKLLEQLWPILSMSSKARLAETKVSDRSVHILMTARGLKNDGLNPAEAFALLWYRPFNKYRQRPWVLADVVYSMYD